MNAKLRVAGGKIMANYELTQMQKEELEKIGELYRETIYSSANTNLPDMIKAFADGLKDIGGEISLKIVSEVFRFHKIISSNYIPLMRKRIDGLYQALSKQLPRGKDKGKVKNQDKGKGTSFYIAWRQKTWESALRKILKYYFEGASINLSDIVALRIILDSNIPEKQLEDICHQAKDICIDYFSQQLCTLMPPSKIVGNNLLYKDYILNPKPNGYKSIHLIFMDVDNNIFEVQIRTQKMDADAEYGLNCTDDSKLEHTGYKDLEYQDLIPYIFFDPQKVTNVPLFKTYKVKDSNGIEKIIVVDKIGLCKVKSFEELAYTF